MAPIPELFRRLVDDAAMFPPGLAPLDRAVADHCRHRESWYADLVGPLLCRSSDTQRLQSTRDVHLQVVAIADISDTLTGKVTKQARELADIPGIDVAGVEVAPLPPKGPRDFYAPLTDLTEDTGIPVWCEVALDRNWQRTLDQIGWRGFRAKLRTGGLDADAFPTEQGVAAFVDRCLANGVTFKATAGLHHAVRHTAADTGFEHHGFLNLLCAVAEARRRGDTATTLAERNADVVVEVVRRLDVPAVRSAFHSFGCCGVTDPVDDLVRLGLVTP